MTHKGLF